MAHRLEALTPGTPVIVGATRVGEVRGVYADGDSRAVSLVAVYWTSRDQVVALSASDIETVDDSGVVLIGGETATYEKLAPFDPTEMTTIHEIAPSE
jgi:hypothetical protein